MPIIPTWQSINVNDGFLACTLFQPSSHDLRPRPVVICCHGLTGTRIGSCYRYVHLGQKLAASGIACITFDFRGCGESSGRFDLLTPQSMREDLQTLCGWLRAQPWVDADLMGVCAGSFGAVTASAQAEATRSIKAAALWAPVAHPHQLVAQYMNDDAWALLRTQGWLPHRGLRLGRDFFDQVVEENQDAATQLALSDCPTLIFHGTGDREVPFQHARAYETAFQQAPALLRIEPLATDDHGMRDVQLSQRLIEESAAWFVEHLR